MQLAKFAPAMALLSCASGVAAQDLLLDPATVELPPMTFGNDPAVAKNGYKFFFFHNPNLDFAEAARDIAECHSHLPTSAFLSLPGFVPWTEANERETAQTASPYGLVGEAIRAIIAPKLERGQRNNKMRLCMERRGYVRYAIDEAAYDAIWEGEPSQIVAMQAKLATGPAPNAPEVMR